MKNWNSGDVIVMQNAAGNDVFRILLRVYREYAVTLPLYSELRRENNYSTVVAGEMMHCDLGKTQCVTLDDLERNAELVRSMNTSEFLGLLTKVGEALGFPMPSSMVTVTVPDGMDYQSTPVLGPVMPELQDTPYVVKLRIIAAQAKAERDVYKEMYLALLEKVTGK